MELYKGDKVWLQLGSKKLKERIEPQSGIRQGCTLSATLFKLITYRIIKEFNKVSKGYVTDKLNVNALFFADDGMLVNDTISEAENAINQMQRIASEYGLKINRDKSNAMIFNTKQKMDQVGGIKVVEEMKYLGITINNGRDIFKNHKENKIKLAETLSNITYSVISRSTNRLLIGKTYWKSIVLPAVLYGSNVVEYNEKEQERLQVIQNQVCRRILNAPKWATNSATRGEIGMSTMSSRIIKSRLNYVNNRRKEGNELIKTVMNELEENEGRWKTFTRKQCDKINIEQKKAQGMGKQEIRKATEDKDTEKWKEEMSKKKTLRYYRSNKTNIKQDEEYDNTRQSDIWFRIKTNCLYLGDRMTDNKTCKQCQNELEDLPHFLLHCEKLKEPRNKSIHLQRPMKESEAQTISEFLFDNLELETKKSVVENLWTQRKLLLKQQDADQHS